MTEIQEHCEVGGKTVPVSWQAWAVEQKQVPFEGRIKSLRHTQKFIQLA